MSTINALIKKRPVLTFYALAFALSWGGVLLVVGGPSGVPATPEQFEKLFPLMIPALEAGPTVAGLLLTGLVYGRAGFRELLSRLFKRRVGVRWCGVALLTAPLLMTALPLALTLFFPEFLPRIFAADDKASLLGLGIAAGLTAGIFEELGWTGFAVPRLRLRYGLLRTGLIAGFLWGAWHLLVNVWSSGDPSGALAPDLFLHSFLFSMGILPAFRVLMVWVYDRTGSLLAAMLMHLSLTTGNVLFVPRSVAGATGVIWSLVVAAALWAVVAAVIAADRRRAARVGP